MYLRLLKRKKENLKTENSLKKTETKLEDAFKNKKIKTMIDFDREECNSIKSGITKSCNHLHPAPSTSTQPHPLTPRLFKPPASSLQHSQQYLNQNIAHNWAISPNLGQKIKSCLF